MAREQAKVEFRAIYYGELTVVVAGVVALVAFWGQMVALFGAQSIGSVASVLAALAAFLGFLVSWQAPQANGHNGVYAWGHRVLTSFALAFCHAAIALLLTIAIFYLTQSAFQGVRLGHWTAAVVAGLVAGIFGYSAYLAGARMTSLRLSTTLAVFMVSGAMVSMITAPNPYWWQIHFSSLGGGASVSATAFNLTLIMGGLVLVGLADLVAGEFARWQATRAELGSVRVNVIRLTLATIGVFLAGVGIFAYDEHLLVHNIAAGMMTLVFVALTLGMSWLAPGIGQAFYLFSYVMGGGVILCMWLFLGVGYFNLTAAELVIAGIIFAWLVVFVRQIAAGLADSGASARVTR